MARCSTGPRKLGTLVSSPTSFCKVFTVIAAMWAAPPRMSRQVVMGRPYGCSTSQEVAGSIPYIVLAQFRLELTKLSCLCLVNPLTNAHLPVPVPPGPRLFQRQGVWLRFSD